MGLTLTEKEHFTKRLQQRADEALARIQGEDPIWLRDVKLAAEQEVAGVLGVTEMLASRLTQVAQIQAYQQALSELDQRITGKIQGLSPLSASHRSEERYGHTPSDFEQYPAQIRSTVRGFVAQIVDLRKSDHPIGHLIAGIEKNAANYRDEIMACSSHAQLQTLWKEVKENIESVEDEPERKPRKVSTRKRKG